MQMSHHQVYPACRGARPDRKIFVVETAVCYRNVFVAEAVEHNAARAVQIERDCSGISVFTLYLDGYPLSVEQVGEAVCKNNAGKTKERRYNRYRQERFSQAFLNSNLGCSHKKRTKRWSGSVACLKLVAHQSPMRVSSPRASYP